MTSTERTNATDLRVLALAVRSESPALHRERRWAWLTRRDEGEYRQYSTEEQHSQAGFSAGRMQWHFHHGLLCAALIAVSCGGTDATPSDTTEPNPVAESEPVETVPDRIAWAAPSR